MCDHSPNREAAMVVIKDGVWCDPCIEPLVRALNDGGLQTVASCCGHGRRPSRVALADGREVVLFASVEQASSALDTWPGINDDGDGRVPGQIGGIPMPDQNESVSPMPMYLDGDIEQHDRGPDCDEHDCEPVYIPKDAARRRAWCDEHGLTDEERAPIEEYVRICETPHSDRRDDDERLTPDELDLVFPPPRSARGSEQ